MLIKVTNQRSTKNMRFLSSASRARVFRGEKVDLKQGTDRKPGPPGVWNEVCAATDVPEP